jgi:TnpA family transposase
MQTVEDLVPDSEAADPDTRTRALLAGRIATVSGFVKILTQHVEFGADPEARVVLEAMRALPRLLDGRRKIVREDLVEELLAGSWRRLVLPGAGRIDKNSYVFCVLTHFHRHLKRREIYAPASTRWCDPKAQLLDASAYRLARDEALAALGLPTDPTALLEQHALTLHLALSEVAERAAVGDGEVSVDADGRLHVRRLNALPDPPSLVDLAARTKAMLPRVDLPELILEVMGWVPAFEAAFTAPGGNPTRLDDLGLSLAACLAVSAMNLDHTAVIKKGVPALERGRISHVAQNYLDVEAYGRANAPLIEAQADIGFARALGGGLLAAVDGMRFVVPVPSIYARPNRKYFGAKRGVTWLNVINDRGIGLAGKVFSGTPRDSLHMIDVVYSQDGGQRPDVIVSDAGSYCDLVFGLVHLLDMEYRPALADLPDHKGWRIKPEGGYGLLDTFARGLIDLNKIRSRWEEILRVVVSIHTGAIRAYDVVTMLQREGRLTPLGEAVASYGRIFKTLHILATATEESYRRDIKGLRNLQEERHGLAEKIFHGKKGELYQRYHKGMEAQLGGLGLILNCVTLWNTRYIDAGLNQLRALGYEVRDEDAARLSPFAHAQLNVTGTYSFLLPDLAGGLRPLRDGEDNDPAR